MWQSVVVPRQLHVSIAQFCCTICGVLRSSQTNFSGGVIGVSYTLNMLTCINSMRRDKRWVLWNVRGMSSLWYSIDMVLKFSVLVNISMILPLKLASELTETFGPLESLRLMTVTASTDPKLVYRCRAIMRGRITIAYHLTLSFGKMTTQTTNIFQFLPWKN